MFFFGFGLRLHRLAESIPARNFAEPILGNLLRSPGINAQLGGPVRQPYTAEVGINTGKSVECPTPI
jgi:hypothetical protein